MMMKTQISKTQRMQQNSSKMEIYSNTVLPPETRKNLKESNITPKATRKRRRNKTQSQERKEIIKIRGKMNEIQMKRTAEKISETKNWLSEKINKMDKSLAKLIKKTQRGLKSINFKKERLQWTPQKYKDHKRL